MTCILLLAASLAAVPADLPFDPETIVEQVTCRQGGEPRLFPLDTNEFMLDTVPLGSTRDPDPVGPPAVAWNGEDYLVVWKAPYAPNYSVCAARVSGAGQLLDTAGIVVCGSTGDSRTECAVAWGGDAWLVVWPHSSYSIRAARVSTEGRVIGSDFLIADTPRTCRMPSVAGADSLLLVAWHDDRRGQRWDFDIYCARVSLDGQLMDTSGIRVCAVTSTEIGAVSPTVASDGREFLITWDSERTGFWDIWGARIAASGAVLDSGFIIAGEGYHDRSPAAAFDGTNYLVAWQAGAEARADIRAVRVSVSGEVLDRQPRPVSVAPQAQEQPSVTFDGDNYIVAWHDWRNGNRDIYGARVSPSGQVLDPDGVRWTANSCDETEPAIAAGDSSSLVVWQDWRWTNDADLFATRIGPDASVLDSAFPVPDTQRLGFLYANQTGPSVACDGAGYLAVWQEDRDAGTGEDIYGVRIGASGSVLDSVPIAICTVTAEQGYVDVAWGDSCYLVVWRDLRVSSGYGSEIFGARVTRSGIVLDPNGLWLSEGTSVGEHGPAIAFDGNDFYVTWYRETGGNYRHLEAAWVSTGGRVLRRGVGISGEGYKPDIAYADSGLGLLTWIDQRWNSGSANEEYAGRIAPDRTYLDPEGLDLTPGHFYEGPPAAASDGRDFFVVFENSSESAIYGLEVSAQGDIGAALMLSSSGSPSKPEPAQVYDGWSYFVAWPEERTLQAARYDPRLGMVVERRTVDVADGAVWTPAVCRGPNRDLLVVYAAFTYTISGHPVGRPRIWGKFISDAGYPAPPAYLWPPYNHYFEQLPVVLFVDSLRPELDSFDFVVLVGNDTAWTFHSTVPRCTVPEHVLDPVRQHRWACRAFDDTLWSRYGDLWPFWYVPLGIQEEQGPALPQLAGATIIRRGQPLVAGRSGSRVGPQSLCVYVADGRLVRRISSGDNAGITWDYRDEAGRPVPVGLYIVRLADTAGRVVQRKLVLVE